MTDYCALADKVLPDHFIATAALIACSRCS